MNFFTCWERKPIHIKRLSEEAWCISFFMDIGNIMFGNHHCKSEAVIVKLEILTIRTAPQYGKLVEFLITAQTINFSWRKMRWKGPYMF